MIKIGFVSYVDGNSELLIKDGDTGKLVTIKCCLTEEQIEDLDEILGMCLYNEAELDNYLIKKC